MTKDTKRRDKVIKSCGFDPKSFRQKQDIRKVLEGIPERQRTAYWLRAICGEQWKYIGNELGVSPTRAVEIFNAAKRTMRKNHSLTDEQRLLLVIGVINHA